MNIAGSSYGLVFALFTLMKKIIIIAFSMLLLSACVKEEQEQNTDSQIIDLLNQNKSDEALVKINEALKTNNSDEILYLKASALSMSAGVDIYALFPLLKIKVFDVAISQWSENREFQKKAQSQRVDIGINNSDIGKEKDPADKKEYVPLNTENLKFYFSPSTPYGYENNSHCDINISASLISDVYSDRSIFTSYRSDSQAVCKSFVDKNYAFLDETFPMPDELLNKIKSALSDEHHSYWLTRRNKANQNNSYMKALGTFWTLIDMIPVVSKIPKISTDGFKKLEEAQAILSKIKESRSQRGDELGQKTRKQLMMISALKIVAHIQNSFDLDDIKSPVDLLCKSRDNAAEELMASEKDALYLLSTIEDKEIIDKNKAMFEEIQTKYQDIMDEEVQNTELRDIRLEKFRQALIKQKEANCDN